MSKYIIPQPSIINNNENGYHFEISFNKKFYEATSTSYDMWYLLDPTVSFSTDSSATNETQEVTLQIVYNQNTNTELIAQELERSDTEMRFDILSSSMNLLWRLRYNSIFLVSSLSSVTGYFPTWNFIVEIPLYPSSYENFSNITIDRHFGWRFN